jgi:hypothetical protein
MIINPDFHLISIFIGTTIYIGGIFFNNKKEVVYLPMGTCIKCGDEDVRLYQCTTCSAKYCEHCKGNGLDEDCESDPEAEEHSQD